MRRYFRPSAIRAHHGTIHLRGRAAAHAPPTRGFLARASRGRASLRLKRGVAAFPRAEAAIEYLDQFPLDEMPEDALNLMRVLYSLISISFAIEAWRQPHVPDSGAAYLDLVLEPQP